MVLLQPLFTRPLENKLNTLEVLGRKGLVTTTRCSLCDESEESVEHVFRSCPFVVGLWICIQRRYGVKLVASPSFDTWLFSNCKKKKLLGGDCCWSVVFPILLWSLWKARNDRVFNSNPPAAEAIMAYAKKLALESGQAFSKPKVGAYIPVLVKWLPPSLGCFIINTDGSRRHSDGHAAAGGLIRDSSGNWVAGFLLNIGATGSIEAELWGIKQGLALAVEVGCSSVIIELDALVVVQFLKSSLVDSHPCSPLVFECLDLMTKLTVLEIRHIFREGNRCADRLASMAHTASQGLSILSNPPEEVAELLQDDIAGQGVLRASDTIS